MAAPSIVTASKIEATTGTSRTAAITQPSAGNLMVCHSSGYQGTASEATASDSVNGTYTVGTRHDNGDTQICSFYFANLATGVGITGTVTTGTGGGGVVGIFHEVSGAATTSPETGTKTGTTGTAQYVTSTSLTPGDAESILFAAIGNTDGGNPANYTVNFTGSTGGTWATYSDTNSRELNGGSYPVTGVAYLTRTSATACEHYWSVNNGAYAVNIIAFKAAGGGTSHALEGTGTGTSSSTGAAGATRPASGTANGASSALGALSATNPIEGVANGTSTATGALATARPAAGVANGAGAASGDLTAANPLGGTADGTATSTGDPTMQWALAGVANGASTASAALTITGGGVVLTLTATQVGSVIRLAWAA